MLPGSAKPCTICPVAGQMKSPAAVEAAGGCVAGRVAGGAAGGGALGGADATGPGAAAAGVSDDRNRASSASEYGCFVAIGSVFSMLEDCSGGGAAMVPPGPGSGRDVTLLAGTGVVSITGAASDGADGAAGGVAIGGTGSGARGACSTCVGADRCAIGAG